MSKNGTSYKKKREDEALWYEYQQREKEGFFRKILRNPLFFSKDRIGFNYIFPKEQMAAVLERQISNGKVDNLLNVSCGKGKDFRYIEHMAKRVYGVDLSPIALKS